MRLTLSNLLQRILEWYFGLPAREPGQVSQWNISARMPWPHHWPTSVVWLLLAALVVFVMEVYRRDARSLSWVKRSTLITLRCLCLALVLVI